MDSAASSTKVAQHQDTAQLPSPAATQSRKQTATQSSKPALEPLKAKPPPPSPPVAVSPPSVDLNNLGGVELEWESIDGARTYDVQVAVLVPPDGAPSLAPEWKDAVRSSTQRRCRVENDLLPPLAGCVTRVRGINDGGAGPWVQSPRFWRVQPAQADG